MRLLQVLTPLLAAACLSAAPMAASAQAPPTTPAIVPPSTLVQNALSNVQSTTSGLNIARWKAPRDMRKAAQQNVNSIQSDLGVQMPQLIARADGAPSSVPHSFDLYRNIDALYDVLLRVSRTADAGAPRPEAEAVAASLEQLEQARAALANQILQVARAHEARLATLERAATTAPSPRAESSSLPHETVVVDGPVASTHHRTARRTARREPAKSGTNPQK